jgi:hypothetical protein
MTKQTARGASGEPASQRRYKILVGTTDIAGQLSAFADGFRQLGHKVTTAISEKNPFYPDVQYDIEVSRREIQWSWKVNRSAQVAWLLWLAARRRLIARHDVFVFMWAGKSLLDYNSEYPFLKLLGKRIVSIFNGDDVRHWSAYSQQLAPLIQENSSERLEDLDITYANDPLSRPLRNLRTAERYSDLILSVPNQSGLALRPYMHFFVPLKMSEYKADIPGRDIPLVVHAPSNRAVKGTDIILQTLERLKAEGYLFELRFLQGMSNSQVVSELTQADVVIDQLHFPLHGKLGVEAMASGCALATCDRAGYEPFPANRPIWHIDPENVGVQLKRLLSDRELRIRLAQEGRAYVERFHDHIKVARLLVESISAEKIEPYDHYPMFFAQQYTLPHGQEVPEPLKRMTAEIVQRWGLPEGVDPQDMIARGLMSADGLNFTKSIPRWKPVPSAVTI